MKSTPEPGAEPSAAELRERALRLLARREHCRAELARKLEAAGFDAGDVQPLLVEFRRRTGCPTTASQKAGSPITAPKQAVSSWSTSCGSAACATMSSKRYWATTGTPKPNGRAQCGKRNLVPHQPMRQAEHDKRDICRGAVLVQTPSAKQ